MHGKITSFFSHVTPHVEGDDHVNHHTLGPARLNDINGTNHENGLSAHVGKDEKFTPEERQAHQKELLNARLNIYQNTLHTPSFSQKKTIKKQVGPFDVPVMNWAVPRLTDVHVGSKRSFNEHKASSKLKEAFFKADEEIRTEFLKELETEITSSLHKPEVHKRLSKLHYELNSPKKDYPVDLRTSQEKNSTLQQQDGLNRKDREKKRHKLVAGVGSAWLHHDQRKAERRITSLESPSTYEKHIAQNQGHQVTNRPLYMETFVQQARASKQPLPLPGVFNSAKERQQFKQDTFTELANAIRNFQGNEKPEQEKTQDLYKAIRPILYSKERETLHRCIRDMTRQLKKVGVNPSDLEKLNELIPEEAGKGLRLMQSVKGHLGKQMRLQDEAERMALALPIMLKVISDNKLEGTLKNNLMYFNLEGVEALIQHLGSSTTSEYPSQITIDFVKSRQGQSFAKACLAWGKENLRTPDGEHATKALKKKLSNPLSQPTEVIFALKQMLQHGDRDLPSVLMGEHQHLFMETTDKEFWEKESLDKIWTPLTHTSTNTSNEESNSKSRIYKQMNLRAAMMGMEKKEVEAFMLQGIGNTLNNRNMIIEGTKVTGMIGAGMGNALSTPLTVPASKTPLGGLAYIPGVLDTVLMPTGWVLGQIPGAGVGAWMAHEKKKRLDEASSVENIIPIQHSNQPGLYTSDRKLPELNWQSGNLQSLRWDTLESPVKLQNPVTNYGAWALQNPVRKWQDPFKQWDSPITTSEKEKSSSEAMHISSVRQYGAAHGNLWKGIGKESIEAAYKGLRFTLVKGPVAAWNDWVVHGGEMKFGKKP